MVFFFACRCATVRLRRKSNRGTPYIAETGVSRFVRVARVTVAHLLTLKEFVFFCLREMSCLHHPYLRC
jgi:hypothetical protein